MSNVIALERKKEVDPQLVEILRDLLKQAENGDVVGLAFVVSLGDGSIGRTWVCRPGCNPITQLGMIEILKRQILQEYNETGER